MILKVLGNLARTHAKPQTKKTKQNQIKRKAGIILTIHIKISTNKDIV